MLVITCSHMSHYNFYVKIKLKCYSLFAQILHLHSYKINFLQLELQASDPKENATTSPAIEILESTEKVANALTSTLPDNGRVDLYRPNIGKQNTLHTNLHCDVSIKCSALCMLYRQCHA